MIDWEIRTWLFKTDGTTARRSSPLVMPCGSCAAGIQAGSLWASSHGHSFPQGSVPEPAHLVCGLGELLLPLIMLGRGFLSSLGLWEIEIWIWSYQLCWLTLRMELMGLTSAVGSECGSAGTAQQSSRTLVVPQHCGHSQSPVCTTVHCWEQFTWRQARAFPSLFCHKSEVRMSSLSIYKTSLQARNLM